MQKKTIQTIQTTLFLFDYLWDLYTLRFLRQRERERERERERKGERDRERENLSIFTLYVCSFVRLSLTKLEFLIIFCKVVAKALQKTTWQMNAPADPAKPAETSMA